EGNFGGKLPTRRRARPQRHAELCDRREYRGRRPGGAAPKEKDKNPRCGQLKLLTQTPPAGRSRPPHPSPPPPPPPQTPHGEDHLRPQRPQPEFARQARTADLWARDLERRRETVS